MVSKGSCSCCNTHIHRYEHGYKHISIYLYIYGCTHPKQAADSVKAGHQQPLTLSHTHHKYQHTQHHKYQHTLQRTTWECFIVFIAIPENHTPEMSVVAANTDTVVLKSTSPSAIVSKVLKSNAELFLILQDMGSFSIHICQRVTLYSLVYSFN